MINSFTEQLLTSFINKPSSSLIIEGDVALGADDLLHTLEVELLGDSHRGNKIIIDPVEENSIGIETVRELKTKLATISGRERTITRIACIKQAEKLTVEAQNALLKLIEEPANNTLLIVQCPDATNLIDTISSRCQMIKILPITKEQAKQYAQNNNASDEEWKKAYLLSGGKAKLFEDLLNGESTQVTTQIQTGKEFLTQSTFDRLSRFKEHGNSESISPLIDSLLIIAQAGLHGSNQQNSVRWQSILKEVRACRDLLSNNVNTKLVFLRLCLMV